MQWSGQLYGPGYFNLQEGQDPSASLVEENSLPVLGIRSPDYTRLESFHSNSTQ